MNSLLWCLFICMILFPIGIYFIQKHNLNYYKLNGRTPIEIECWLKTRKWYWKFVLNIQNEILEQYRLEDDSLQVTKEIQDEIDDKCTEIMSGKLGTNTISEAFCWMNTSEGTKYWGKKEYKFLMWYYGQFIDLHLFK